MQRCCCYLDCYSNVPPQSCVLQVRQTARKAQLASSVPSGIPSTCPDYLEDVDTDDSVFSLSLQAEGRTPPYSKNKALSSDCVAHQRKHDSSCSAEPRQHCTFACTYASKHSLCAYSMHSHVWMLARRLHTHTHAQVLLLHKRWQIGQCAPSCSLEHEWYGSVPAGLDCHSAKLL